MTRDGVEQLVSMVNWLAGSKMAVIGKGSALKATDENGRSLLGDRFMTAEELGNRAEGVLFFLQRGGASKMGESAAQRGIEKGRGRAV